MPSANKFLKGDFSTIVVKLSTITNLSLLQCSMVISHTAYDEVQAIVGLIVAIEVMVMDTTSIVICEKL